MKMLTKILLPTVIAVTACIVDVRSTEASLIVTPTSTNNTSVSSGGTASESAAAHSLTNGGAVSTGVFVGASVTATTRYTSTVVADRGGGGLFTGGVSSRQIDTNYSLSFSIADPGPGVVYDVDITTLLRGSLSSLDDHDGFGIAGLNRITNVNANVGALSVAFGGGQVQTGSTSSVDLGTSSTSGAELATVNEARNHSITGLTGANVINLSFNWTTRSESRRSAGAGGDENAVRFGEVVALANATVQNYPGIGNRDINGDGHFVNFRVTITAVPEPSSALLAMTSLVGVVGLRRRRS